MDEELFAECRARVGKAYDTIEPARAPQNCRIEGGWIVGGGHNDQTLTCRHSIEGIEQLLQANAGPRPAIRTAGPGPLKR